MAILSPPPASSLQESIPPPPQSGNPSAHHAPSTPQPTGRSSISSSVGQRQIQPPRRSPALVGSPPKVQASPPQPPDSQVEREPPTSAPHRQYRYFTSEDDALLIALHKKNDGHWPQIHQQFEQAARPSRSKRVLYARYEVLQAQAIRQQGLAKNASSSSSSSSSVPSASTAQPLSDDAAMAAASSMLHAQLQLGQTWSSKEVQTLRDIPKAAPRKTIYPDFCAAFPLTRRTSMAVVAKWRRIHFEGQTQRRGGRASVPAGAQRDSGAGEMEEVEGELSEWPSMRTEEDDSCSILAMSPPAERPEPESDHLSKAARPSNAASQTDQNLAPCPNSSELPHHLALPASWGANDALYAIDSSTMHPDWTGDASLASLDDGHAQLRTTDTASWTSQHTPKARTIRYSINRTPNGFLITDFPPGYTLLILTPTRVQVVERELGAHPNELSYDGGEEHQLAPFAFKVKDGAIETINLPQGTATSICLVRARVGDGRGEANAGDDGRLVSQTSFVAKDGFSVVIESEVA